jgi:hypothetical protein
MLCAVLSAALLGVIHQRGESPPSLPRTLPSISMHLGLLSPFLALRHKLDPAVISQGKLPLRNLTN